MKLYVRYFSPYSRIVRAFVIEKGLESWFELIEAQTRVVDSAFYRINPSGRVPFLLTDEGIGLEETAIICAFIDALDGASILHGHPHDNNWEHGRLEGHARSFVDGLAVWYREKNNRPSAKHAEHILSHEFLRAERLADLFERATLTTTLSGPLNMPQLTLVSALDFASVYLSWDWRNDRPNLVEWSNRMYERKSIALTRPSLKPVSKYSEFHPASA